MNFRLDGGSKKLSGPLKSIYKVAILVDWENVRFRLFDREILKKRKIPEEKIIDYNREPKRVIKLLKSFLGPDSEELFRIYSYTCVFPDTVRLRNGNLLCLIKG